ncbi:MAG: phosphotransferase [Deltaproteobacteria bacterium]
MINESLVKLFTEWANEKPFKITPLPQSGSNRKYYRIRSSQKIAIGVDSSDHKENLAYVEFTNHFLKFGLNVPVIYSLDLVNGVYLLEDLGDITLFSYLTEKRNDDKFPAKIRNIYKKVLEHLPEFQIKAANKFPYECCYPRSEFDNQSMKWDLNYFKYYFLKLAQIDFDEQALENDFQTFIDYLLKAPRDYFLYRDFQSRNIMLSGEKIFFIDFQGGRKGALQYDVASLLYDAKAAIPFEIREELLDHYINILKKYIVIDPVEFRSLYYGYVLIRIMQAMGAYGFRGFYEKKAHFLASIPYALQNMKEVLSMIDLPVRLPTLIPVLKKLTESERLLEIGTNRKKLKVSLNSFSYKRGIPVDESGHGGGFAFDCRALDNPGRYEQYKKHTGKDLRVIEFLKKDEDVQRFIYHVTQIIEISLDNYLERDFSNLMINFGCTGGQHRSVFMAEYFAEYIRNKYNVNVALRHRELEMKEEIS